mmetsp:Transcript_110696/g.220056  ORF Transcript_110696/g.220056 Transcript_110696/m.220056 type:complete len:422 (+) Transcript_110696:99-1364(+)
MALQTERIVSPLIVLGLHALLLADVAAHQRELLDLHLVRSVAEWVVAGFSVLFYLCTVLRDPGFLKPAVKSGKLQLLPVAAAFGWVPAMAAGLWALRRSMSSRDGAREAKNARGAEDRELQPIGRSAWDVLGEIEEVGSDPGEEAIEVADLESASSALPSVGRGGGGGDHKEGKGGSSLGAVPGSPRPGFGRPFRNKRREQVPSGDGPAKSGQQPTALQSGHRLRYCKVCCMHQPLRTKHCRDCGCCIRTHDHHCPWVGTCIGEGNRCHFWWFLAAQSLELFVFGFEGLRALLEKGINFSVWINVMPSLVFGLILMVLLFIMVTCLLAFHSYLAMANLTTWENISWHHISYLRSLHPEDGSPFSQSLGSNLAAYCCPAPQLCWVSAARQRTEDGWAVWELGEPQPPCGSCCCPPRCFEPGD